MSKSPIHLTQTSLIDLEVKAIAGDLDIRWAIPLNRPWANLVVSGVQPIFNQLSGGSIRTNDWVLIVATPCYENVTKLLPADIVAPTKDHATVGAIGAAQIVGSIDSHSGETSRWFNGFFAFKVGRTIQFEEPCPIATPNSHLAWELGPADRLSVANSVKQHQAT